MQVKALSYAKVKEGSAARRMSMVAFSARAGVHAAVARNAGGYAG